MRAVAMDMDGTFLRPDSTYDRPRFERLLGRLRELDVRLVIASGNQVDRLREYFDPTDGLFYVSENGHYIHEGQNASPLFAAPRLGEAATGVIDVLEHIAAPYLVSTRAGAFMPAWASRAGLPWAQKYYPRLALVEDIRTLAPELVTASINIEYPFTAAERLREALGGCMDVVVSGPADVDLNSPGHNKATGLARLLESWDIDPGHVVALGDNLNDAEMLALAGTAVAVANAQPEITAIADIVAPSNDADGALTALEELITRQSLTGRQSPTSR